MGRKSANPYHLLPKLLSVEEVCKYLQVGETIVREMIRKGEIKHIRIRSRIRVSEEDILEYLQRNTSGQERATG